MSGIKHPLHPVSGFYWLGKNIGILDNSLDFGLCLSEQPATAAAVFTKNTFCGAPIIVGRQHLSDGKLQLFAVNSKNANVATGADGTADTQRICELLSNRFSISIQDILPSSTGIIGRRLPIERIVEKLNIERSELSPSAEAITDFATAIMTTDTRPKAVSIKTEGFTITGVAKGSGMIAPNMATMLAYFVTDAQIDAEPLQQILRAVVGRSFNCISVDTDTSTSDTVAIMANGQNCTAGNGMATDLAQFEHALDEAALYLAKEVARDGEGATKLIELKLANAPSLEAGKSLAFAVINSPLVKTALHGADPNWGRFVMALGKVGVTQIALENIQISFGSKQLTLTAQPASEKMLGAIRDYLKKTELYIEINVDCGQYDFTAWGCDLSAEYVRINAHYST